MKGILILAALLFIALYYIIAEGIWQFRNRLFRRRIITGVLIAAMLLSQTSIADVFTITDATTVAAAEQDTDSVVEAEGATGIHNEEGRTISAFIELPEDIREQAVPVGTALEELVLPDTLEAVIAADTETDTNTDSDKGADTDTATDADVNTDADKGADTDTDTDADVNTDVDEGADTDAYVDSDTDVDAGNGAGTNADAEDNTEAAEAETFSVTMPEYRTEKIIEVKTLDADSLSGNSDEESGDSKEAERSGILETSLKTITIENITWQSEPEYDGDTEGEYIFAAKLPEGYMLTDWVNAPQITVTVGETDDTALLSGDGIMAIAASHTTHDGISSAWKDTTSLPTSKGNYYLETDVTLSSSDNWKPSKDIKLCLNGHSITYSGWSSNPAIYVDSSGKTICIYDCQSTGTVTNQGSGAALACYNGECRIYGGIFEAKAETASTIYCGSDGEINTFGGKFIHNNGGIVIESNDGDLLISDCTITGRSSDTKGVVGIKVSGLNHPFIINGVTIITEGNYTGTDDTLTDKGVWCNSARGIVGNTVSCDITSTNRAVWITGIGGISTSGNTFKGQYGIVNEADPKPDPNGQYALSIHTPSTFTCDIADIYLASGKKITIYSSQPAGTPPMSVLTQTDPKPNSPVVITANDGIQNSSRADLFTAADSRYFVRKNSDGQIELAMTYAITYEKGTGSGITGSVSSGTKQEGVDFQLSSDTFTRVGYTQKGWATTDGGAKVYDLGGTYTTDEDITLYPYWEANQYTVSFNSAGGSSVSTTMRVTYDSAYGDLPKTTRDGYTFDGWYTAQTGGTKVESTTPVTIADDHTLYAKWTATAYTITYNLNSGTNNSSNPATYTIEDAVTLQDPTRTGYTFGGWYTTANFSGNKVTNIAKGSTGNKTFYAKWTATAYTITYNLNSGTNNSANPANYTIEDAVTLQDPTRTGYTFGGWYTTANFSGNKVTNIAKGSTGNKTFYAKWTATAYTITYNLNSGTNNSANPANYTIEDAVTLQDPTRTGYTFGGWYTTANFSGNKVTNIAKGSTGNKTYYAKWTAKQYTVSFDSAGGSSVSTTMQVTYDSAYGDLPETTRDGYTFDGWYTAKTGGTKVERTTKVDIAGEHTLYAHWKGSEYDVTLKYQDGKTDDKKITVTYGSTYGTDLPSEPSRAGYHFAGWFTQEEGGDKVDSNSTVTMAQDHTLFARWVDDINPVIEELSYNYTPKTVNGWLIGKDQLVITVPVREEGSGVSEITYTVTPDGGTPEAKTASLKGTEDAAVKKATITVNADFKGTIRIDCQDVAGNPAASVTVGANLSGAAGSAGIIIEDNAPTVSFEIDGSAVSGETGYYDVAPAVKVTVADDMDNAISGGIASVIYQVDGGSEQQVTEDFTTTIIEQCIFTIPSGEIHTGIHTITVKVEDNAGNTGEATLIVKVKGPEETPEATIDEVHVAITDLIPEAEYDITYKDADGTPHTDTVTADENGSLEIEDDWTGGDIEIVKKGNGTETTDSQPQELEIPKREPGISGELTVTDESIKGANDGKIGGLEPGEEYEVSSDGGKTWEKKTANEAGEIEPLAPGSYDVRRPAEDDTLPSKSVHVDIKESNFTREEKPDASIPAGDNKIGGLIPGAEYDITYTDEDGNEHTDTRTADENGNLDIEDDWTDKSVDITKKGDGTGTVDSPPDNLDIPGREEDPSDAKMTKQAGTDGQGGSIGGLEPGEIYQISKDGGETWEDVIADDQGEISPIGSGSYDIRKKAGEDTLPSHSVHVEVTKQQAQNSSGGSTDGNNGSSSSGSGSGSQSSGNNSGETGTGNNTAGGTQTGTDTMGGTQSGMQTGTGARNVRGNSTGSNRTAVSSSSNTVVTDNKDSSRSASTDRITNSTAGASPEAGEDAATAYFAAHLRIAVVFASMCILVILVILFILALVKRRKEEPVS